MIYNRVFSPLVAEALEELNFKDMEGLCPNLQKLFNELMFFRGNRPYRGLPHEISKERQGYANGFKDKVPQTRLGLCNIFFQNC